MPGEAAIYQSNQYISTVYMVRRDASLITTTSEEELSMELYEIGRCRIEEDIAASKSRK
jgi:hypothetical protein